MAEKMDLPEVYTEQERDAVEAHISAHFGECESVLHEVESPDIHVDIYVIEPNKDRNYYTLITVGMGAHKMDVPEEIKEKKLDRAEIMVTLPPDWEIHSDEENWYWPLRWLKVLARLPGQTDTWLGYGHTVPNGPYFAENTELCGVMLTMPRKFSNEAAVCALPGGDQVTFYQMLPLYDNEISYKVHNGAEALENLFPDDFDLVVNVNRKNVLSEKNWFIKASEITDLFHWDEPEGCLATDRIMVDGAKVGYMYREAPEVGVPDSGWRFTAGDESEEYMDNPNNAGVYALNTIANYDPEIIQLLHAPHGSAFMRDAEGVFRAVSRL